MPPRKSFESLLSYSLKRRSRLCRLIVIDWRAIACVWSGVQLS
jgi:hypothetical protein